MNTGSEIAVVGLSGRFPGAGGVEDADTIDAAFFGLTPGEAGALDPQHRLFLACAREALEAAGHDPETRRGTVGVYAGLGPGACPVPMPEDGPDDPASLISGRLHLTGPSLTVQASGASALVAVHLAAQGLLGGECDLALAGGSSFRAASGGGGVGVVVLKRLDDAVADGDPILALIKGSAINHGGAGRRDGEAARREGQARVVRTAEFLAEVDPATVGYVETSGIAGLIQAVLALDREVIPAGPRAWKRGAEPRRAAVSSFSPGGANAHVILEEAPAPAPEARDTDPPRTSRTAAPAPGASRPELAPVPRGGDLPLSFAQQRLWLLDQLAPGNPFYNLTSALRLSGPLDAAALRAALAEVVRRHEVLRTGFVAVEGLPAQRIEAAPEWSAPLIDLGALPAGAREGEVSRLAREQARRPFDLARPPLLRATLLRLEGAGHVLLITFHHIVSDGWSMGVLAHDVSRLYAAFAAGQPSPLAEPPVQYADFAVWQRSWLQGEILEGQLAYWRERLAGAPPVELPADHPRPPVQSFRGATLRTHLPAELAAAAAALARGQNVSLFMVLLAGFDALISRYTGLEDVVVGTPITGRTRADLEGLIGLFVNTLVLRADLSGDPKVPEMLSRVREMAVGAYGHQDLPFEYLVEKLQPRRDLARNPLFQIMFNLMNAPAGEVATGGLRVSRMEAATGTALFDLQVYLTETSGGIAASWEHATDLFDAATVERMAGHFRTLLAGMAARPEARLADLPLLSPDERDQLVMGRSSTARRVPPGHVHDWIAARAALTPEAVAVVMDAGELTYRQLDRRANALARRLRSLGVGPEARVGVALERAPEMVVALLAVLKAGGAYVPLDPAYPAERLAFMRQDSGAAVVLTAELLREVAGEEADLPPGGGADPRNLAYVIYTSGSTGRPKGVQIPHLALANFLASMAERPGLAASDVMLAVTSLSFDIAGLELWLPLMVGARVVLASREEAADGRRLRELIAASGATVLQATPATWRLLLESGWEGGEGLKALCGGEALPPALAAALRPRVASLWNVYGPTETTVWSTLDEVVDDGPISIGRPVANTGAYVLDGRGNLMPPGAPGELYLGGLGLARGYLGRPELTAERFVPDPFGPPGARLYRTGDLARHRAGGRLEHLGRIDHQVKIRGYRIELGEIEAALGGHPEVEAAVVVAREEAGDRRLVAYVVARRPDLDLAGELRGWVLRGLPEYMAPAAWVRLDRLPLTPNGKVDRKALPAPAAAEARPSRAPGTPTEEALAAIWASVLGVAAVGAEDNFFALGGHSLLAAQVISRVRESLGVELPLSRLFEAPVLSALARVIDASWGVRIDAAPIPRAPRGGDLPLSFAQERLWVLDRMDPGNPAYNIGAGLRLKGALRREALADSLTEIVRRHAVLRSAVALVGGEPRQVVAPAAPVPLPLVDLAGLPEAAREAETRRLARLLGRRPFDLARGAMLRATLLRLGEEEHAALFTVHHIASDGWSMGVLTSELSALYAAFRDGRPSPLPEPPIQYLDYAHWQRGWLTGEVLAEQLAYWRQALAGIEPLRLPTDRPRPAFQTFCGATRGFALPAGLSAALRALGQRQGGTLFMVLLAAFSALLHRLSGQDDIPVGSPAANRSRAQLEGLIGFFVNTLVLRADLSGAPSFARLLDQVRRSALAAFAHQELPFEKVVFELQPERNLSSSPLFQVMLAHQNAPAQALALPGLELGSFGMETGTAKFDLTLNAGELPGGRGIVGSLEHNADLFDRATIDRWLGSFQRLLEAVAADPAVSVDAVPLLSPAERHQTVVEASDTAAAWPREARLHEQIARRSAARPDAVAVTHGDERLTHGELEARSNRLARRLARHGVGRGSLVGLCMERSLAMPVALLAILKTGAAYVPMDPAYPEERLAHMLEDAGLALLLAGPGAPGGLLRRAAGRVVVAGLEELEAAAGAESAADPRVPGDPADLAYVLYTSGSTGRPKGVEIPHGALVNFLAAMAERPGLAGGDVLLAVTSLSFDIAALELYLPLLAGARVDLAERETAADGARLLARLRAVGATVLQATPATWRMLVDAGWTGDPPLRALCGGEALPERLAGELRARSREVWNLYGPTETTVWSAVARVEEGGIAFGRPIANTRIDLLDPGLGPVPTGVPGELCIGGVGLARGYRRRPDLTAERFVPNPFADLDGEPGARLYRTGDLARRRPDGALELLGRVDHQVKVRGFRVEPGEIEAALEAHPGVARAVVVARGGEGERSLVAYLVPRGGAPLSVAELRESLGRDLPDYMIPSGWVLLDELPLTPNGKVDRRALPAPESAGGPALGAAAPVPPRTALEEVVAGIWAEVLRVERVGVQDNFFVLGGHSLLATQVVSRIGEALEVEVPLRRLFEAPTVAGLAAAMLRAAADPEELERAAALVLDLLRLSEDEVDLLLLQHAGAGDDSMEAR